MNFNLEKFVVGKLSNFYQTFIKLLRKTQHTQHTDFQKFNLYIKMYLNIYKKYTNVTSSNGTITNKIILYQIFVIPKLYNL